MILSDRDIRTAIADGTITIDPFDERCIQPSSVDLHVDSQFRVFANSRYPYIDVREEMPDLTELVEVKPDEPFILHPGEFVLGSTLERVALPDDLVARLEGKSSLGRLGLLIHSTAGYVDPGWDGYLTLELSNVANLPITLYPGMKIGQISFFQLTSAAETPYGAAGNKYQGQRGPDAEPVLPRLRELSPRSLVDHGARDRAHAHLHGHHRGLRAVGDAQLAEDRREVRLDRLLRQEQRPRDLTVRATLGEQRQDVVLALGQAVLAAAAVDRPPDVPGPRTGSGSRAG